MLTGLNNSNLLIYLLALTLGVIYCLSFAPIGWWPSVIVAVAGLYVLLQKNPTVNPGLLTWAFGIGKYGLGASWVYVSINVYGGASPLLASVLVILFVCFAAWLFCWPLGWLYGKLRTQAKPVLSVLVFTACWVFMDWMQTWFLTGFPWLYAANGLLGTVFAAWVPILGMVGASGLLVLSGVSLWLAIQPNTRVFGWSAVLLPWLIGFGLSFVEWVEVGEAKRVALVQGNIDQAIKWQPEQALPNYRKHLELSQEAWDADLVVWPEAAITVYPQRAGIWLEELTQRSLATKTSMIVGIPGVSQVEDRYEFYNLALGLGEAKGRFAKHHLVPFGEYVPFEGLLRGLIGFFDLPMSSMSAGPADQINIRTPFGEVAMAICYEVAYPESMRRSAKTASLLATITNDTWFGASFGPHQHMEIAQARALENGRWLVRGTNNGITGIVDHRGQLVDSLPQFEEGTLMGEVRLTSGTTPYGYWGHIPVFIFLLATLAVGLRHRI